MGWKDSLQAVVSSPITAPVVAGKALYDQFAGEKEREKAREEALLYATPSGATMQNDINIATREAKTAGRARGQELFGQESALTPVSQDILKRRMDLSQGLNAQEMAAIRGQARDQIQGDTQSQLRQLQAIQGRQGMKGGAASAQQAGVLLSGADQQRQLEQNLIAQNYAARTQGLNSLASDVNARLYGIQASEAGASNQALAEQSLAKGLAIGSLPTPQQKPGILGGVSQELSVICTELKRQGILDEETQKADCIFGLLVISKAPHVYMGYVVWAKYIALLMRKSRTFTRFVSLLAVPWANHMAFSLSYKREDNLLGRTIHNIGFPLCGIIGKIIFKIQRKQWPKTNPIYSE